MNRPIPFAGDVEALAALHAACFAEPWTAQALADLLATPGTFALTCLPDGFVLARAAGGEAEVLTLAVAPHARRKGMGLALLSAACLRAGQLGATTMFLEVAHSNSAARALYERFGFCEVGMRKAYYGRTFGENALIMRAELPSPPLGKS
jgi:ribosomal-protein-alanine N-acetyltransferase